MRMIKNVSKWLLTFIYFSYVASKRNNVSIYLTLGAIGDTCYALAFSKYVMNKGNCIIFVNEKMKEMVLSSYPLINKDFFSFYCLDTLKGSIIKTMIFSSSLSNFFSRRGIYVLYPSFKRNSNDNKDDFFTIVCNRNLKINTLSEIVFPSIKPEKVISIKDFENKKEKIVVCNPYSNSMIIENAEYIWNNIVEQLRLNGYIVYTNIVGSQKVIKGSYPLACSVKELGNIALNIPLFVSIRTGILDYLIDTSCAKYVIYGKCTVPNVTSEEMYNIYNLDAWGKKNISQFFLSSGKSEDLLQNFQIFLSNLRMD